MRRWWRSHSVRVQLTLWYAAAMIVVLGLYAAAVFASVSRSMSDSLDQRLRSDFWWAAAMVDQRPDGTVTWLEPEGVRRRGSALAAGLEPGRRAALPELGSRAVCRCRKAPASPPRPTTRSPWCRPTPRRSACSATAGRFGRRIPTPAGRHPDRAQRGADAAAAQRPGGHSRARPAARRGGGRLRRLFARPAGAGAGRADDRSRADDHRRTTERPAAGSQSGQRDGTAGDGVQRDAGPARGVVRADAAVHRRCLARAEDAADGDPQRRRSRAARASRRAATTARSSAACSRKWIGCPVWSIAC